MTLKLASGGARIVIDGETLVDKVPAEYEAIYDHFDRLLKDGTSYVDPAPFKLVADAFFVGSRSAVEAFED